MRTKTVHKWVYPVRDIRGNIVEPGRWEESTITVPDPPKPKEHNEVTGCMWVVLAVIFIAALFAIAWLNGDSEPGKCRTELGYMGQVEVVDCEER